MISAHMHTSIAAPTCRCLPCFDVHARELEQLLEGAAVRSGRADEPQHHLISIDIARVGHVHGDVPQHTQRTLLQGHLGQRQLRNNGVGKAAVAEAVAERQDRLPRVELIGAAWVGEGRPHRPACTLSHHQHQHRHRHQHSPAGTHVEVEH